MHDGEGALYEAIAGLQVGDLGPRTRDSVEGVLLDHLACVYQGADLPWIRTVTGALAATVGRPVEGQPAAGAVGVSEALTPADAALVNGTAAHGFDFDDTHLPTMTHPGAVVISAVLATAEAHDVEGPDVVAAVVGGYEIMVRAAELVGLGFGERGFHATGQLGPLGAAAAVARLHRMSADDIAGAVGLAASFGGGIKSFTEGHGTIKRVHAGRAAQAGVLAAAMQKSGVQGPLRVLTNRFGVGETFSCGGTFDSEVLTDRLGHQYAVDEVYLKRFPACGAVHGAMAAAETFAGIDTDLISEIRVGTSARALSQNSIPRPADVMAAQYSTEYAVSAAIIGRAADPTAFMAVDRAEGEHLRALTQRVRLHVDARAEADYPAINRATVELCLTNGATRSATGDVSAAESRGGDVAAIKLAAITRGIVSREVVEQIEQCVRGLADGAMPRDMILGSDEPDVTR